MSAVARAISSGPHPDLVALVNRDFDWGDIPFEKRVRILATHESAHAVVAVRFNRKLAGVTLRRMTYKRQKWRMPSSLTDPWLSNQLLIMLAGVAATEYAFGFTRGGDGDIPECEELISQFTDDGDLIDTIMDLAWAEARTMVRSLWPFIESVAHDLIEHGELTGVEIDRAIDRA